jgi:hypothetical protein
MAISGRDALASGVALACGVLPASADASPSKESALMADTMVRRVSINTHLSWRSTLWGNRAWRTLFKAIGLRHTHSRLGVTQAALNDPKVFGVPMINLIGGSDYDKTVGKAELDFAAANANWMKALEGPNEPNNGNPPGWHVKAKDWCKWLFDTARASPVLAAKPIVGPSFWGRETAAYNALGNLSGMMDIGNLHYYTGGRKPTEAGFPLSYDEGGDPNDIYTLEDAIREAKNISPNRPLWITEQNWPASGPECPLSPLFVTNGAQARYLLRVENYKRKIELTAVYSLIDDVQPDPPRGADHMIAKAPKSIQICRGTVKLALLTFAGAALLTSSVRAETVQAASADSFVEFIGLNYHLNWRGTIWETESPTLRQRLGELGIRYVRSAMAATPFARENLKLLHANYGVRANVLVEPRKPDGTLDTAPVRPLLADLRDRVGVENVVSFEGPNEYSKTKYYGNDYWVSQTRSFQSFLHSAVRAIPAFNAAPVIGPTIWRETEEDHRQLGNLGSTADQGAIHYYPGGLRPSRYLRLITYPGIASESLMDMMIQDAQINTPSKKINVTEMGYNIRTTLPRSRFFVSERTSAKYTLRLISEFFLRRVLVSRTYLFSMLDADPTKQYGLLRTDLSPRPSFYAIKNTIALLSDRGPAFQPGVITFFLSGDRTDVKTIVLQKRDGRFYILVWIDAVSYDPNTLAETDLQRPLTLDIRQSGATGFSQLNVYKPTALDVADPNSGMLPVRTVISPGVISFSASDQLKLVELIP